MNVVDLFLASRDLFFASVETPKKINHQAKPPPNWPSGTKEVTAMNIKLAGQSGPKFVEKFNWENKMNQNKSNSAW